jgi:hypothetical protein
MSLLAGKQLLKPLDISGSLTVTGSINVSGSVSASVFSGSGAGLFNIPAGSIVGLNLSQITSGSVSASISPNNGLQVNTFVQAPSFTGSLYGTSSWSTNATTASYAPAYLPLTGGIINGNVTVNGTASIAFLNVTYESASVIYSSGSNTFGDSTSDIQTLVGTVIVSGSQQITGSLNVTGDITGSLFGTASYALSASNSISASYSLSSSYAVSSSFATSASVAISSSYATTASYVSSNFQYEIHVSQIDGNDTTGDGSLLKPVATITKGLTLVGSQRKTIIVHPGTYTESPSITIQYTTITGPGLIGGNIVIAGTVSTNNGCTISGIKMTNLTITTPAGAGNVNILNCEISGTLTKSSNADYTVLRLCDYGAANITGAGLVAIFGGNPNFTTVNNASANVIIKSAVTIAPVLTAGTLNLVDSVVVAAVTNAVTSAASSAITIANCQLLTSALNNVAPVVLNGFYSILNCVFDKPTSTLVASSGTGGSTNSIDYFQYINADNINSTQGLTVTGSLTISGSSTFTNIGPAVFSGSVISTQGFSGSFSGSLTGTATTASYVTGSVFGLTNPVTSASYALTASYALNAGSAGSFVTSSWTGSIASQFAGTSSYAQTASYTPNYLPLTGGTITGNVTLNGTASIAYLNVAYESASVIYSSGSNQFGDAANDTQTLYGTVVVPVGSLIVTGSIRTTDGITGSFSGSVAGYVPNTATSSFVTNSQTSSFVQNSQTSSFVTSAQTSSMTVATASYVTASNITGTVLSASFATTASYAANATPFPYIGNATVTGSFTVSGSGQTFKLLGSGSGLFQVTGSQGGLFQISDTTQGQLFTVSNILGNSLFSVSSSGDVIMGTPAEPALYTTTTTILNAGSTTIYSIPTANYMSVYYDYNIMSESNARAGQIMAMWSGSSVNFTEVTTTDFGDTSGVVFNVSISGANMILSSSAATAAWTFKSIVRSI